MKHKIIVGSICVVALIGAVFSWLFFRTTEVANAKMNGIYFGNQRWNGEMRITGDVSILGNLTVKAGTTVRFAVGDDQSKGDEVPADGYNDNDPTRLLSYGKTHAQLFVLRKFIAVGTKERPVTFTSAAEHPTYADWESIVFLSDGSMVNNAIVEYSRNGLNPIGDQPHSVIQNSTIRHTFWGAVSSSQSTISVLNNHLYDCGHEGVDVQREQTVKGNLIEDCHAGIVILKGSPIVEDNIIKNSSDGIGVDPRATPMLRNNTIIPADPGMNHKYTYQGFSYNLFGEPDRYE